MSTRNNSVLHIGVSGLLAIFVFIFSKDLFFFWDTVQLASKHGHWYYDNSFSSFFLPEHIDSGHPPIFGMYLAVVWSLLGKTLWSSHIAMIPFVWTFYYYTIRYVQAYSRLSSWFLIFLVLVACTPMLGHIILVSPDVVLMSMFVASLYFLQASRRTALLFSILILALVSQRGCVVALALLSWFYVFEKNNRRLLLSFIPGLSLFILFYILHYVHTGWNVAHADSPWSGSFEWTNFSALFKNIVIYFWRLLDFGMIAIWLTLLPVLVNTKRNATDQDSSWQRFACQDNLFYLLLWLFLVLGAVTVPFFGLVNHRYYLPIHWLLCVWTIVHAYKLDRAYMKPILTFICIVAFSGHRWVYPSHISQGWDTSLCHVPFYKLRDEVMQYAQLNNIPGGTIGTGFPLSTDQRYIDLQVDEGSMRRYDLTQDSLVLWSNVMNEFKDKDIVTLEQDFIPIFDRSQHGVNMKLYKRK